MQCGGITIGGGGGMGVQGSEDKLPVPNTDYVPTSHCAIQNISMKLVRVGLSILKSVRFKFC